MKSSLFERLPECSATLWKKAGMRPEYTAHGEKRWVRMDADVTVFDNADTKKYPGSLPAGLT